MNEPAPKFDELWNYSKPVETEIVFRKILADYGESAGDAYSAELETQIARCLSLQRRFEEAHKQLDAIKDLPFLLTGRGRIRYLLERGRTFNSSRDKAAALPLFIEAWEIGLAVGEDGLAVDAAHMVAIAAPDEALKWNEIALELAEKSCQPTARKWRKSLHNNLGWTYFELGNLEQALHHFESCRDVAAEYGDSESERIADWSIAKTYRLQGKLEEAMDIQLSQLSALEAAGEDGPYVYEELAECLYALGRTDEAAPYFKRAHEHLSNDPWLAEREPQRIERLRLLAETSGQPLNGSEFAGS